MRVGDIYQLKCGGSSSYLQVSHSTSGGPILRVLPGTFEVQLTRHEIAELVQRRESFHVCILPRKPAFKKVGNLPVPEHARAFPTLAGDNTHVYLEHPDGHLPHRLMNENDHPTGWSHMLFRVEDVCYMIEWGWSWNRRREFEEEFRRRNNRSFSFPEGILRAADEFFKGVARLPPRDQCASAAADGDSARWEVFLYFDARGAAERVALELNSLPTVVTAVVGDSSETGKIPLVVQTVSLEEESDIIRIAENAGGVYDGHGTVLGGKDG